MDKKIENLIEYVKEEFNNWEIEIDIAGICYNELPENNPLYKYANNNKEMIVRYWANENGGGEFCITIRDYVREYWVPNYLDTKYISEIENKLNNEIL